MAPPAPARWSITNGWPQDSVSFSVTRRPTMSVEPPGVNGTTRRTGLVGYCCALDVAHASASTAATPWRMADGEWRKERLTVTASLRHRVTTSGALGGARLPPTSGGLRHLALHLGNPVLAGLEAGRRAHVLLHRRPQLGIGKREVHRDAV